MNSGADLIQTATYQSGLELFASCGYSKEQTEAYLRKGVDIASRACDGSNAKVVLSLGSFGSTLSPGAEYSGRYPAPYGPFDDPSKPQRSDTDNYVASLTQFHYDRILLFANDAHTWAQIAYIAFETTPLLSEGLAIRAAVRRLHNAMPSLERKPWFIAFVFPSGLCPQSLHDGVDAAAFTAEHIAHATFDARPGLAMPDGIGINCTKLRYLPALVDGYSKGIERLDLGRKPLLVLYPDGGGSVYNVVTREWEVDEGKSAGSAKEWAQELLRLGESAEALWSNVILGGCCKAGNQHIAALRQAINER